MFGRNGELKAQNGSVSHLYSQEMTDIPAQELLNPHYNPVGRSINAQKGVILTDVHLSHLSVRKCPTPPIIRPNLNIPNGNIPVRRV